MKKLFLMALLTGWMITVSAQTNVPEAHTCRWSKTEAPDGTAASRMSARSL